MATRAALAILSVFASCELGLAFDDTALLQQSVQVSEDWNLFRPRNKRQTEKTNSGSDISPFPSADADLLEQDPASTAEETQPLLQAGAAKPATTRTSKFTPAAPKAPVTPAGPRARPAATPKDAEAGAAIALARSKALGSESLISESKSKGNAIRLRVNFGGKLMDVQAFTGQPVQTLMKAACKKQRMTWEGCKHLIKFVWKDRLFRLDNKDTPKSLGMADGDVVRMFKHETRN
eukprot:CAMPEP_0171169576 /NCGR_PEP_ID=MMETSP0790-20130122/8282_1 /TAXON_ID=2925 /ORGANISM="Alexandrium catenella, Strain OF101" /LENGTH=234 /DNA_ID=CAMNT_0011634421 /DNA_START=123 /DNA_END=827 /DNA_ORIENTATION=+